ncbi:titin isoform X2 [Aedes aegypti]|uniref:PWWP domain-containing protein n=1 Tax=Aedes aegypti TaxID=7159 RepID=A0A6I8TKE3_AEDAE|nr:titin isoform X2 [Aedes aegypti]
MDDDGEYNDGDIVWVKLSYCWWPGEVKAGDHQTEELLSTLKRRPLAVVKFFEEDSYEYVKNTNFIYKYNCSRKHEFLRKGLEQYRAKNKHMEKFPADVMHAERATGGDPNIVNSKDFLPQKRESYADIFGDKSKGRASSGKNANKKVVSPSKVIPVIPVKKHEVRILGQASSSTGLTAGSRSFSSSLTSASSLSSTPRSVVNTSSQNLSLDATAVSSSSLASPAQIYHCHKCGMESGRQNVIVLHTRYCRAVPMSIPSVKVAKPIPITPEKVEPDTTLKIVESPRKLVASTPKTEIEEKIDKIAEEDELVEVIQVVEPVKPTRSGRTPRAAAPAAKSTPKIDRRRNRGKGRAAAVPESEEKVEVFMEVADDKEESMKVEDKVEEKEIEVEKTDESVDKDDSKDSKGKLELKNELLADWSEDEQDDQEDSAKEDEAVKNEEQVSDSKTENAASNSLDASLEKSVDCSPQLASPVSSGTTIKYRNIPKKQKREFIEVTNDQPAAPVTSTVEKSSSESSISTTAATCGGDTTLNTSDKTPTSNESFLERPISAKQRILDRATRGSSKSISSDETKQESPVKAATQESQPATDDDSKKETSCFDFKEDEDEEVVLNKSPRRSLSNRRDTSLEVSTGVVDSVKEQEELERAKRDVELKNKVESLLCETSLPSLPEIPKIPKAPSPGPSSSTETTSQLKEEIDRNRTLPPKERGKRIFKTRNKIIENEAIALEQSKAIVMDFVKKSHEEELAELLEQQKAEAKLSSESPTTTNDDSQESVLSNEPTRFENSEFAAIKSKRTKISQAENVLALTNLAQEPSVSSTNEAKDTATEPMTVSISKEQLALEALTATATPTPKGRKGKQRKSATPIIEKTVETIVESEARVEDATPKGRKKRGVEKQASEMVVLDVSSSAKHEVEKAVEISQPEPESHVKETTSKGRKKRGVEQQSSETTVLDVSSSATPEVEKAVEVPEPEPEPRIKETTSKGRKKRGVEQQASETPVLHVSSSAMSEVGKAVEIPDPEPESRVKETTSKGRKQRTTEPPSSELTSNDAEAGQSVEKTPPPETPAVETVVPKGRKKRGTELQNLEVSSPLPKSHRVATVVIEKMVEETPEPESQSHVAETSLKSHKKRSGGEVQSSDVVPEVDTTKADEPVVETVEPEVVPSVEVTPPKGRKKRSSELQNLELMASDTLRVVIETPLKISPEPEYQPPIEEATPKGRRKRGGDIQDAESVTIEVPASTTPEVEKAPEVPEPETPLPKGRRKRGGEVQNLDLVAQDTLRVVITKSDEGIAEPLPEAEVADVTVKGRKKRGVELHKVEEPVEKTLEVPTQESVSSHSVVSPKGRKKRGYTHLPDVVTQETSISAAEVVEKPVETVPELEPEQPAQVVDTPLKGRKKRGNEVQISDPIVTEKLVVEAPEPSAEVAQDKTKENEEPQSADKPIVETPPAELTSEKQIEDSHEPQAELQHEDPSPKGRKKRGGELQKLDLTALDTPRSRRGRGAKVEEPTVVHEEPEQLKEEQRVESPTFPEKHLKLKRAKKDVEVTDENVSKTHHVEEVPKPDTLPHPVDEPKEEPKPTKSKRSKQLQQRLADSTAEDIPVASEPPVPTNEKVEPAIPEQSEPTPVVKHQPIKMIIKSRGRKSNSELLYEPNVVSAEPKEDEVKEKLPKSPKSSKRKKASVEESVDVPPPPVSTPSFDTIVESKSSSKSPKHKRPKIVEEPPKPTEDFKVCEDKPQDRVPSGPSDTDLQIAEALIHLPNVTPPKHVEGDQEMAETKPNSSSPVLTAKTINPRKRHLQTLMSSPELTEQPKPPKQEETVTIPEKKKRETVPVVNVAAAEEPTATDKIGSSQMDEDKFDIDNIPIVMDDSELLEESTISTTTSNQKPIEETSPQMPATKPMLKKMMIVKSSNGSPKIIVPKESRDTVQPVPKKNLGIKSSTITIKPPVDQLSPKPTHSPAHSPPIRGTQLVQANSVGQIVITSKGTVFTTQSPTTSTTKSSRSGSPKTHVTPAKAGSIVSSVNSVSTISSSTSKSSPPPASLTVHRTVVEPPVKSPPAKICVQSQEIIYPPTKSRPSTTKPQHDTSSSAASQKKTSSSSTSPPKKVLIKKHTDAHSPTSSGKPLFSTSKGNPITPQPATSSAVSPGKKAHKVIKISPQKLKEFTRLGMVEDKGQGKVLTASGMKKFRQEQYQLQKQQRSRPEEPKKLPRADSVDEEPSTSTPTPPPPSEAPAEVVVAAAADSSVKEIQPIPADTEELTEVGLATTSTESMETSPSTAEVAVLPEPSSTEENEADAAVKEPEAESTEAEVPSPPVEALESVECAPVAAVEVAAEASESGSNVQESSQLIAVPAENFGGPSNLFYLCSVREEGFVPVNNELLYLDSSNQLVALPENASVEDIVNQAEVLEIPTGGDQATVVTATAAVDAEGGIEVGQQNILLNTQDGQQIILDQQSLMALAAGGDTSQLLTPDGQQILLQDPPLPSEIIQVNPNTTVETNAVLTKPPIMSAVEVPTKNGAEPSVCSPEQKPLEAAPSNLDESLAAVIGVPGNPNVPTSLELPITVTNPVIAKTTTSKINPIYPPTTAISAIALDAATAAAAGTVIGLPTVAQTGTDSSHDETHETSSSDDTNRNKDDDDDHPLQETKSEKLNGRKSIDEDDEENRDSNAENDIDEIIPNTPESQMNSHAEISSQFSDDESEVPVPIPNVDVDDEDDNVSNCSEIIPIQPNVVILRNVNNELLNNNDNDNSSDMEIDNPEPTSGNEENNPNQSSYSDGANNSTLVER